MTDEQMLLAGRLTFLPSACGWWDQGTLLHLLKRERGIDQEVALQAK